ncbi:MAG: alpha-galactosidase, partial [Fusobacteriaceae bacterium]|nr:alpha-galactosidase [Fusobacteriales bacterium]MDN5305195.1 alpha-galactosidase [Fusobacteriaceae bacterium]
KDLAKKYVKKYKEIRKLIQFGDFYRLLSPFEGNSCSWMIVSKDKSEAIIGYYTILSEVNPSYKELKLVGLDENIIYSVSENNKECYGDELMNIGIKLNPDYIGTDINGIDESGDFVSKIITIKKI